MSSRSCLCTIKFSFHVLYIVSVSNVKVHMYDASSNILSLLGEHHTESYGTAGYNDEREVNELTAQITLLDG